MTRAQRIHAIPLFPSRVFFSFAFQILYRVTQQPASGPLHFAVLCTYKHCTHAAFDCAAPRCVWLLGYLACLIARLARSARSASAWSAWSTSTLPVPYSAALSLARAFGPGLCCWRLGPAPRPARSPIPPPPSVSCAYSPRAITS
jgi:hypothetical protein